MTSNMRDGELTLTERIDAALLRVTNGEGAMRVPVEATDPDIVLADCRLAVAALHELLDVERMRQRMECHKAADTFDGEVLRWKSYRLRRSEAYETALRRLASRDHEQFTSAELVVINEAHVRRAKVFGGA